MLAKLEQIKETEVAKELACSILGYTVGRAAFSGVRSDAIAILEGSSGALEDRRETDNSWLQTFESSSKPVQRESSPSSPHALQIVAGGTSVFPEVFLVKPPLLTRPRRTVCAGCLSRIIERRYGRIRGIRQPTNTPTLSTPGPGRRPTGQANWFLLLVDPNLGASKASD